MEGGDSNRPVEGREGKEEDSNAETLSATQWQRDGRRLSSRQPEQRVHSVSGGPPGGPEPSGGISEEEEEETEPHDRSRQQPGPSVSTTEKEKKNLQMGAPPGSGVHQAGASGGRPSSSSSSASSSSVGPGGLAGRASASLYPSFTPLSMSVEAGTATLTREEEVTDVSDPAFLDEDFKECWWVKAQDNANVLVLGWATRHNNRAIVYTVGGGVWSGTMHEHAMACPRIADEVKKQQDARTLTLSKRTEAARSGAEQYLRKFRRETGGLPTRSTWRNAWKGETDAGGRQILVCLKCHQCGMERLLRMDDADAVPSMYQTRGFSCGNLCDVKCGEPGRGPRGGPFTIKPPEEPIVGDESPRQESVKRETEENVAPEDDEVEVVGFSSAAKQFYKARGP